MPSLIPGNDINIPVLNPTDLIKQGQYAGLAGALGSIDPNKPGAGDQAALAFLRAGDVQSAQAAQALQTQRMQRDIIMNGGMTPNLPSRGRNVLETVAPSSAATTSSSTSTAGEPQQVDPNLVAETHAKGADALESLISIPAGPERQAKAAELIKAHAAEYGLDPAHPEVRAILANVNDDDTLHAAATELRKGAGEAAPAGPTPSGAEAPSDLTTEDAKWIMGPQGQAWATRLKWAGGDPAIWIDAAKYKLDPQHAAATTAANYDTQPQELEDKYTGRTTQFATGALARQALEHDPDRWGKPSTTPTVDLTEAATGKKVTFANQDAARAAVLANPGKYGEPGIAEKAIQGRGGDLVTITSTGADGSPQTETIPYAQAIEKYGYQKAQDALNGSGASSGGSSSGSTGNTRGDRNNNPTNMKLNSSGQQFNGYTGADDGGYVKFDTVEHGLRAADINLQNYGKRGINTAAEIANTWAPNAPASYAAGIARAVGAKDVNTPIDLSNPNVRQAVIQGGIIPGEGTMRGGGGSRQVSSGATAPQGRSGAVPGFGVQPSAGQTALAGSDIKQYADIRTTFNDPNFDKTVTQKIQDGNFVSGLAQNPTRAKLAQAEQWAASHGIPVPQGAQNDANIMAKALSKAATTNLAGLGIKNQVEYEAASHSLGAITDPKDSLKYSGAVMTATGQYQAAQKKVQQAYDSLPAAKHSAQEFAEFSQSHMPDFFTMPAFRNVVIGGKPLVQEVNVPGRGRMYEIGEGLGKGNTRYISVSK